MEPNRATIHNIKEDSFLILNQNGHSKEYHAQMAAPVKERVLL
jgi:hypothetical protein